MSDAKKISKAMRVLCHRYYLHVFEKGAAARAELSVLDASMSFTSTQFETANRSQVVMATAARKCAAIRQTT
jgi:predicted ATP-dependent Lon-type protease